MPVVCHGRANRNLWARKTENGLTLSLGSWGCILARGAACHSKSALSVLHTAKVGGCHANDVGHFHHRRLAAQIVGVGQSSSKLQPSC
eukprot:scaffold96261_cov34-Tisochrysis_lutea.AAC.3